MRTKSCGAHLQPTRTRADFRRRLRNSIKLGSLVCLAVTMLVPCARGQKPPAPSPAPNPAPAPSPRPVSGPGSNPGAGIDPGAQPIDRTDDRVMFLRGRVVTRDGSTVPYDVLVERVCNERVKQQIYAGPGGDFDMQMGSKTDTIVDATADLDLREVTAGGNDPNLGIPRRQLLTCELRAVAPGFRPSVLRLMELNVTGGSLDVGNIMIERSTKIDGATLNAAEYRAPKEARKAYEKGLAETRSGKLTEAEKSFEKAVEIYPKYTRAWYKLGVVRQKAKDNDGAKAAYTRATEIETKFVPAYVPLAEMAYEAKNWPEVLRLTERIIALDPLGRTNVTGYVVDLDPVNSAEAYFYNAMANYRLGKVDEAEKSALKAEHVDLLTKFPQLHLLLAEIFSGKAKYGEAIAEIVTYMELVPAAKDLQPLQEQLARLEQLHGAAKRE